MNAAQNLRYSVSRRALAPGIVKYACCFAVGIACGSIVLLDIPLKWEIAILSVMGITVFAVAVGQPERILLFTLAFTVPIYFEKGFVIRSQVVSSANGVGINLSDVLLLVLLLLFLARLAIGQRKIRFFPWVTIPALVWLVLTSLSLLLAADRQLALFQLVNMAKLLLLCWVVAISIHHEVHATWVIAGLMLSMLFQAMVGIYQGVTGHAVGLDFLSETADVQQQMIGAYAVNRVQGTLGSPNTFAVFISVGVPFVLALLLSKTGPYVRILATITLCLMGWALIFSLSRASWGIFLETLCIVFVLAIRRKRISTKAAAGIAGAIALVLLGVALFDSDIILSRLSSDDVGSATSRISLAKGALAIIRDNPVVGVGLNNYTLVSRWYDQADIAAWNRYAPIVHNAFLLIAAETGFVGLAAFLGFLGVLLIQAWRIIDNAPSDMVWVAGVGTLCGLAALITHGMVDYQLLGSNQIFTEFWLLAGLCAALMQRIGHERQDTWQALQFSKTISHG